MNKTSGTPTDWIRKLPDAWLVEVLCECPPEVAVERFLARERHPGHFDERSTRTDLLAEFDLLASQGPLGLGTLVRADTSLSVALPDVVRLVLEALVQEAVPPDGEH